jgi:hypothetical protein
VHESFSTLFRISTNEKLVPKLFLHEAETQINTSLPIDFFLVHQKCTYKIMAETPIKFYCSYLVSDFWMCRIMDDIPIKFCCSYFCLTLNMSDFFGKPLIGLMIFLGNILAVPSWPFVYVPAAYKRER